LFRLGAGADRLAGDPAWRKLVLTALANLGQLDAPKLH